MSTLRPTLGFRFHQLIGQADGAGANLSADADPTGAEPSTARVFNNPNSAQPVSGYLVWVLDGTSIDVRPWVKVLLSDTVSIWVPVADAVTVAAADTPHYFETGPLPHALTFMQLTNRVGSVRRVGWVYS